MDTRTLKETLDRVIDELLGGGQNDPVLLAEQGQGYPTAVVQRAGHLGRTNESLA